MTVRAASRARPGRPRPPAPGRAGSGEALRWLVPIAILIVWQVASGTGLLNPRVLPAPTAMLDALGDLIASGQLAEHFLISARRATLGIAIGGGLGFALGLLTGSQRLAHLLLDSTFQMVRNVPHLALIPLVILWFGVDEAGKIFLIALGTFFPVYLNTAHGVRSVDPRLVEMARAYGVSVPDLYRRVILPGALPSILVGLRYALGIAWLSLVVSESFGARSGIGYLAMDAREFMRTDVVVLAILIYAGIGKAADSLVRLLERRWLPWREDVAA